MEKNSALQIHINRIKGKRDEYIEKNMYIKNLDEDEQKIYDNAKKQYDREIKALREQMIEIDTEERDTIKEFEIFIKILQRAPQYFKNATYVQKRRITDLTISNIIITAEKTVKIKVRKGLDDIFDPKFSSFGAQ